MKTPITLLLTACVAFGQSLSDPAFVSSLTVPASGSAPTYVIEEYCEGTGTPAGWTDGTAPDWDYTTTALEGVQSVRLGGSGGSSYYTIPDADFYEAVLLVRLSDATPASNRGLFGFRTSAAALLCAAQINTSGQLMVYADGSASTATTDALSDATTYYVKLIWNDAGTCSIEFSTTTTFTGSGNKYTSKTGGTTADCTRFYIGATSSSSVNTILDSILVDNAVITP